MIVLMQALIPANFHFWFPPGRSKHEWQLGNRRHFLCRRTSSIYDRSWLRSFLQSESIMLIAEGRLLRLLFLRQLSTDRHRHA